MNITGAFALILGAIFSTYVFMPKRRVLAYSLDPNQPGDEFLFNLLHRAGRDHRQPRRVAARAPSGRCSTGRIHSRVPGHDPDRDRRVRRRPWRTRLNRFGMTELFQLGKFLGVVFLFAGFLVSIEVFREIRIPFTSIRLAPGRHESAGRAGSWPAINETPRPSGPDGGPPSGTADRLGPTMAAVPARARRARADGADRRRAAFLIVLGAAALFGTLGPLSHFAYDAGMEPARVRRLARADRRRSAPAAFVAWRIRRGATPARPAARALAARPRHARWSRRCMGFLLNLLMFIAFDRSRSRSRSSASTPTRRWSRR